MILKKVFYKPSLYPFSLLKGFFLIVTQLWRSIMKPAILPYWSSPEDYREEDLRGRPFLTSRSKVLVGEWEACQEVCPTHCLQIETERGKLVSMWLERERCIHCGLCSEVAPTGGVELLPSFKDSVEYLGFGSFDLVHERDAESSTLE